MKMSFRWYGNGNDTISLAQIRQIPGVEEIVWDCTKKCREKSGRSMRSQQ